MKRIKLFLLLLIGLCYTIPSLAQEAQPKRIPSLLQAVTIYRQGAEVKRSAQVALSPGTNEFIIEGLSNYIDEKSISLSSDADINILSVTYRVDAQKIRQKGSAWKSLSDSLDSLETHFSYSQNQHYALEQEMQLLQENRKIAVPDKGIYVDDLEEAADFYRSRVQEIKDKITVLDEKEKHYSAMIAEVKDKLKEAGDLHSMPAGELLVRLSSTDYGTKDLEIGYQTGMAGWKPIYNLRSKSGNDQVQLDYDGLVSQETGEDWTNMPLSLATGVLRPRLLTPGLNPWYISVEDPDQKYNRYTQANNSKDSIQDYTAEDTTAETTGNKLNIVLPIQLKYNIPPTGKSQYVRIQQYTLSAHFYYLALPELSEQAFKVGQVTGWSDFNLMPGPVSLFRDNTYLGKTLLDPTTDSDTMTLILGRDKDVHISRVKVKDISKKQFIGSSVKEDFVYAVSIKNDRKEAIKVVLEEHIPISQSKELEVKLENAAGAAYDATTGKMSWNVDLEPGQSRIIQYDFSVKYPKGTAIQNLY